MTGAVAVVTGAGRGIGRAIALAYATEGASLVLASRSSHELDEVVTRIEEVGGHAVAVPTDVTDEADLACLADAAAEVGDVDALVLAAGVHRVGAFLDHTLDDWRAVMEVNLVAAVATIRAFLPGMLARGRGRIVPIASTAGRYGSHYQAPYNASKHALVGVVRCLALETAASGVRVNAICPGFVKTAMVEGAYPRLAELLGVDVEQVEKGLLARVPIGRMLEADEVAAMAVYLGSGEADGMTGQALTISGGMVLS